MVTGTLGGEGEERCLEKVEERDRLGAFSTLKVAKEEEEEEEEEDVEEGEKDFERETGGESCDVLMGLFSEGTMELIEEGGVGGAGAAKRTWRDGRSCEYIVFDLATLVIGGEEWVEGEEEREDWGTGEEERRGEGDEGDEEEGRAEWGGEGEEVGICGLVVGVLGGVEEV
eukprot:CAMPEP_0201541826 /NCGR_PEP_ID=MMETSP0161_2-20130828/71682_1 /ASSEMBLY_ACC=CAM_ASM_000251 /TAXON_ID=180227 /ORGANISM="Neoparamoeba aestuarina, Strain SoJaBio B1-5/56/2" /LENGTH=170 /DNA_ID=CAMNT_0047949387 /DNA_START=315 /DNA_END=827 /DNA_ORIENTATION=-